MKLTVELIQNSPDFINTFKARELDLRDNKIPFIENLGATKDRFATIDLTNNEIRSLENFPLLTNLDTLLLSNNKIERIEPRIGARLPGLKWLNLSNNLIASFQQLFNLFGYYPLQPESEAECWKLESVSLIGNEVCRLPYYRELMIFGFPTVRMLDFVRVDDRERALAKSLFLIPKENDDVEYSSLFLQLRNGESVDRKRHAMEIVDDQEWSESKKSQARKCIEEADTLSSLQHIERDLLIGRARTSDAASAISNEGMDESKEMVPSKTVQENGSDDKSE